MSLCKLEMPWMLLVADSHICQGHRSFLICDVAATDSILGIMSEAVAIRMLGQASAPTCEEADSTFSHQVTWGDRSGLQWFCCFAGCTAAGKHERVGSWPEIAERLCSIARGRGCCPPASHQHFEESAAATGAFRSCATVVKPHRTLSFQSGPGILHFIVPHCVNIIGSTI